MANRRMPQSAGGPRAAVRLPPNNGVMNITITMGRAVTGPATTAMDPAITVVGHITDVATIVITPTRQPQCR
jgi:hypothetical protein